MNDERMQILRMVQEGKVSPEEAGRLLDALEQPDRNGGRQKGKNLRVVIADGSRTQNLTVSLGLARWVLQVPGVIGLNLQGATGLTPEALLEMLAGGTVGKVFEAEQGKQRVEIWIEA